MEILEIIIIAITFFCFLLMIAVFVISEVKGWKQDEIHEKNHALNKRIIALQGKGKNRKKTIKVDGNQVFSLESYLKACGTCPFGQECESYREAFGSSECLRDDYGRALMDFLKDSRKERMI